MRNIICRGITVELGVFRRKKVLFFSSASVKTVENRCDVFC